MKQKVPSIWLVLPFLSKRQGQKCKNHISASKNGSEFRVLQIFSIFFPSRRKDVFLSFRFFKFFFSFSHMIFFFLWHPKQAKQVPEEETKHCVIEFGLESGGVWVVELSVCRRTTFPHFVSVHCQNSHD